MIRRTEAILRKILPPKHELIIFITPSESQFEVYNSYIDAMRKKYSGSSSNKISEALPVISALRKILFHPKFYQNQSNFLLTISPGKC
jgi:SNF2 family DNA or RNA helicase